MNKLLLILPIVLIGLLPSAFAEEEMIITLDSDFYYHGDTIQYTIDAPSDISDTIKCAFFEFDQGILKEWEITTDGSEYYTGEITIPKKWNYDIAYLFTCIDDAPYSYGGNFYFSILETPEGHSIVTSDPLYKQETQGFGVIIFNYNESHTNNYAEMQFGDSSSYIILSPTETWAVGDTKLILYEFNISLLKFGTMTLTYEYDNKILTSTTFEYLNESRP